MRTRSRLAFLYGPAQLHLSAFSGRACKHPGDGHDTGNLCAINGWCAVTGGAVCARRLGRAVSTWPELGSLCPRHLYRDALLLRVAAHRRAGSAARQQLVLVWLRAHRFRDDHHRWRAQWPWVTRGERWRRFAAKKSRKTALCVASLRSVAGLSAVSLDCRDEQRRRDAEHHQAICRLDRRQHAGIASQHQIAVAERCEGNA